MSRKKSEKKGGRNAFDPPENRKKEVPFGKMERRRLVSIGRDLCILKPYDIDFIMDESHTEREVREYYSRALKR